MSLSMTQASALEGLLSTSDSELQSPMLAEALLACALGLIEAGEGVRAAALLEKSQEKVGATFGPVWELRASCLHIRSLQVAERFADSLGQAAATREASAELLVSMPEERHTIDIYQAVALGRLGRDLEALECLVRTRTELLAAPDCWLMAAASVSLSTVYISLGARPLALSMALDGLVSARRCGSTYWEAIAHINVCFVERQLCRWASADSSARAAIGLAARLGNAHQENHAKRALALCLMKRGNLPEALVLALECADEAATRGSVVQSAFARLLVSMISTMCGHFERAREAAVGIGRDYANGPVARAAFLAVEFHGDALLEHGEAEPALALFDGAWQDALALNPRGDIVAELRRRRAECFYLLGKHERAYHEAVEAIAHCKELGDRYEEAATYRVIASAAGALGRIDEAQKLFDQGFAMYDDIETPYEWGKLWMSYGVWVASLAAGHRRSLSGANEAFKAAIEHFERIGAEFKLSEAKKLFAELQATVAHEGAELLEVGRRVRPQRRPRRDVELMRRSQRALDNFGTVTCDRTILDMLEELERIATSSLPVLILGESGTGKELIARGVHQLSGRTGSLVDVNCSAVPENLLESEFFGHVVGSFTSAVRDKEGLFESAHHGSAFLDEIGEMSLDMQAKLLRFLETNEVRKVGQTVSRRVDVRIIAATNRERVKLQNGDGFRSDLYFRIAHAVYVLPPLRERGDDVDLLVDHFLRAFCEEGRKSVTLSSSARDRLVTSSWPGNIRQLRGVMSKLVIQAAPGHVVTPREIPECDALGVASSLQGELLDQEKRKIVEALGRAQFIKADAARLLGMSRTTLITKMKRMGISG